MRTTCKKNRKYQATCILFCLLFLMPGPGFCENDRIGVMLTDDSGKVLYEQNSEKLFVPASILKILTSLASLDMLGKSYRFPTDCYYDELSGNLYIKGWGDPLFISEVIPDFCKEIRTAFQLRQIKHIILDQSFFCPSIQIPGRSRTLNPYDAPVGALCANFNTVMFTHLKNGKPVSAEPQTPLLEIFHEPIRQSGLKQDRIVLSENQSRVYAGLLIRHFLIEQGISVTGRVMTGRFPFSPKGTYTFYSPFVLTDIVKRLLTFSNNFIANQLTLRLGAEKFNAPATIEKGTAAVQDFSRKNLGTGGLIISEGSGIARQNQISPRQMIRILLSFMPNHSLLRTNENEYYKTGTLTGIRTRAGFFKGTGRRLYPYVIMINRPDTSCTSIKKKLIKIVARTEFKD